MKYYHIYRVLNFCDYVLVQVVDDYEALIKYIKGINFLYCITISDSIYRRMGEIIRFESLKIGEYPNIFEDTSFPYIEKGELK